MRILPSNNCEKKIPTAIAKLLEKSVNIFLTYYIGNYRFLSLYFVKEMPCLAAEYNIDALDLEETKTE